MLDAEKCKSGIEIPMAVGAGVMGTAGMLFGSIATPSMSPQMTPWIEATPSYGVGMSPSEYLVFPELGKIFVINILMILKYF